MYVHMYACMCGCVLMDGWMDGWMYLCYVGHEGCGGLLSGKGLINNKKHLLAYLREVFL